MKKKVIIPIVILTAIALAIFFIVRQKRKKADETIFPLVHGSEGKEVRQLQIALNRITGNTIVVDGIFGDKTYSALAYTFVIPRVISRAQLRAIEKFNSQSKTPTFEETQSIRDYDKNL